MNGFDFSTLMTPEQIEAAHKASAMAHDQVTGVKLRETLFIGAALLNGHEVAAQVANGKTNGGAYAKALADWKAQFGFGDMPKMFLDYCMITAKNRPIADEIIAATPPHKRVNLGAAGLAKQVRAKLKEIEGKPKIMRVSPQAKLKDELAEVRGQLAHLEEMNAAIEEEALPVSVGWFKDGAVEQMREFVAAIIRIHPLKAKALRDMLDDAVEEFDYAALGEGMVKKGRTAAEKRDARTRKAQEKRAAAAKADRELNAAI